MPDQHDKPPLTEPLIVPCLFCTGVDVDAFEGFVRLIGTVELPVIGAGNPERRIIARMVMPDPVARDLQKTLRRDLARGGH